MIMIANMKHAAMIDVTFSIAVKALRLALITLVSVLCVRVAAYGFGRSGYLAGMAATAASNSLSASLPRLLRASSPSAQVFAPPFIRPLNWTFPWGDRGSKPAPAASSDFLVSSSDFCTDLQADGMISSATSIIAFWVSGVSFFQALSLIE